MLVKRSSNRVHIYSHSVKIVYILTASIYASLAPHEGLSIKRLPQLGDLFRSCWLKKLRTGSSSSIPLPDMSILSRYSITSSVYLEQFLCITSTSGSISPELSLEENPNSGIPTATKRAIISGDMGPLNTNVTPYAWSAVDPILKGYFF